MSEVSETTVFARAADLVRPGDRVGLGSGKAAGKFIDTLGARVRAGLKIQAFPTSVASEIQARSLGIPLLDSADAAEGLDIAIDGADQFAPGSLDLIKGFGRCALREMVVARLSKRFVIVVGSGKCVSKLGETNAAGRPGRIPVEVVPFAEIFVSRGLARLGLTPEPWNIDGIRGLTDNGNHILDCLTGPIDNPSDLDRAIRALPGVVGTGFFLGMAERVLEGDDSFRLVAEYVRGSA